MRSDSQHSPINTDKIMISAILFLSRLEIGDLCSPHIGGESGNLLVPKWRISRAWKLTGGMRGNGR